MIIIAREKHGTNNQYLIFSFKNVILHETKRENNDSK
jgi:hypothetical protein